MDLSFYYRVKSAVKRRILRPALNRAVKFVPVSIQDALGLNLEMAPFSPLALEKKLWSGYSTHALQDLHSIVSARRMMAGVRADAAWALARWHASRAEYALGLQYALLMRALERNRAWDKGQVLLEVDCLNRLGRADEARRSLSHAIQRQGELSDYCLAYSNVLCAAGADDAERLDWINRILSRNGFVEVALLNEQAPLAIDNLRGQGDIPGRDGPRVSVLMPAYNSAGTIEKSIRGLLAQSWRNIEILPVDDCSTDDTWAVLQAFAERDPRVVPIRHEVNTGAYGARLTALTHATGDFITVHDADDWSHPQKVETQVQALLTDDSLVACMSSWCRVSRNLYVNRVGAIPGPNLQRQNESSLMFRRSLVESLGAWDRVRAAADTEFIWRIQAAHGHKAVKVVHEDVPLSFSLSQEDSLTQTGPTHVKTIFYGTRRVYREAQKWWHRHAAAEGELRILPTDSDRRFAAPPHLLRKNPEPGEYDFLFVGDLALTKGVGELQQALIGALAESGEYRIGLFHWPRYEKSVHRPVASYYQELAAVGKVDVIAAEDALKAQHVIVADVIATEHLLDRLPTWEVQKVWACAGHCDGSDFPNGRIEKEMVEANLKSAFGMNAVWLPVSREDADRMHNDDSYEMVSTVFIPWHMGESDSAIRHEIRQALDGLALESVGVQSEVE
ncbi:glycosyltransferase family 2 protein [Halomonas ramblicola]|uniref:glycosyltransferase family 2 protein n=1 Tax=Halomonas ramblicola TaxID=747349 RepID=UPI0025B2A34B|nr:glycosyltransferase family A protein [Halomonas ramblicola]MDN3522082.1 glycosyltransferase family A protein [Halomonas ramblicola]